MQPRLLLLLLALLLVSCRSTDHVEVTKLDPTSVVKDYSVRVKADIPYLPAAPVSDKHKLDLYLPKGVENPPLLMWIHSGAWAINSRKEGSELARRFAERGVAVAAISHRLSPGTWIDPKLSTGVQHPAHVEDCADAFAWLIKNSGRFGFDGTRLYVGGHSSGAHLATLLAMDPKRLQAVEVDPTSIRAAFAIGGAYNLEEYAALIRSNNGNAMADSHIHGVFGEDPAALVDASPITYLGATETPVLVFTETGQGGGTRLYSRVLERAVKVGRHRSIQFVHLDNTHAESQPLMSREQPDRIRDTIVAWILHDR